MFWFLTNQEISATTATRSFAQYVGAGNNKVQDIRISAAKFSVSLLSLNSDLGVFKSIKIYLSGNHTKEFLVAQRTDVGDNVEVL